MTQEPDRDVPGNKSNYDPLFEQLVVNAELNQIEPLTGMIAYAEWKLSNPNSDSSELPMRARSIYLNQAEKLLAYYAGRYAKKIVKEDFERGLIDEEIPRELKIVEYSLSKQIKANKINFWMPVWQSIVASIFFTFALFVLALLIRFAAPDTNAGRLLQYLLAPDSYKLQVIPKNKQ